LCLDAIARLRRFGAFAALPLIVQAEIEHELSRSLQSDALVDKRASLGCLLPPFGPGAQRG
jgi:hypothetical protein